VISSSFAILFSLVGCYFLSTLALTSADSMEKIYLVDSFVIPLASHWTVSTVDLVLVRPHQAKFFCHFRCVSPYRLGALDNTLFLLLG